jgi:hypothetical protein
VDDDLAKRLGMHICAYMAELWGNFEGLNYARRLGLRAVVELHVDSRDSSGGEGVHSRSL